MKFPLTIGQTFISSSNRIVNNFSCDHSNSKIDIINIHLKLSTLNFNRCMSIKMVWNVPYSSQCRLKFFKNASDRNSRRTINMTLWRIFNKFSIIIIYTLRTVTFDPTQIWIENNGIQVCHVINNSGKCLMFIKLFSHKQLLSKIFGHYKKVSKMSTGKFLFNVCGWFYLSLILIVNTNLLSSVY